MATNINLKGITELNITGITSPSISKGVVSFTISQPAATTWNSIGNAAGNLTLANAGYTTTFNQTSAVAWTWANTTTATSGTTNASPLLEVAANYWNGSSSLADTWTIGSSLAAGTNGASTLQVGHAGSTGTAAFSLWPQGTAVAGTTASNSHANSAGAPGTTSLSITINVGDCVVVFCFDGGNQVTVTDNGGNTYVKQQGGTTYGGFVAYTCLSATIAATTVSVGGYTSNQTSIGAATFTGVGAIGASHLTSNASGSTAVSDSVTTTANNSLVVAGMGWSSISGSITIGSLSGTSLTNSAAASSPTYTFGMCIETTAKATTGSVTSSGTLSTSRPFNIASVELLAGGSNGNSIVLQQQTSYWNGSAAATDTWSWTASNNYLATPTATLTLSHSGTSGVATVSIPAFTNVLSYGNIVEQNTLAATSASTSASPNLQFQAQYWTGAASAADTWTIGSSLAAGTNGASTLTFAHSGSTGVASVSVPAGTVAGSSAWGLQFAGASVGMAAIAGIISIQAASGTQPALRFYNGTTAQAVINTLGSGEGTTFVSQTSVMGICGTVTTGNAAPYAVGSGTAVVLGNQNNSSFAATSGTQTAVAIGMGSTTNIGQAIFAPTSGNANFVALLVNPSIDQTSSASGSYTGLLVNVVETSLLGSSNKLLSLQAGATGGTVELDISNKGIITTYNGIATVSNGTPSELAKVDLTAQSAAIAATTAYATTATGMYRISWSAAITTASDTSSVLGGANGFQVLYTSPTDSVVKTTVAGNSVTSATNTTGTALGGSIVVYAKTGTNIQYQYGYTSVQTSVSMAYELHIKVEAM